VVFSSRSYKHTHPDNPDCSGVPMDISNKANGEVKISYTYSVSFQVSAKFFLCQLLKIKSFVLII